MRIKSLLFKAVAHYHTPSEFQYNRIGERISRLSIAHELAEEALRVAKEEKSDLQHLVRNQLDPIVKQLEAAHTSNDESQHNIPADPKTLSPIKRPTTVLVRAKPVPNLCDKNQGFVSVFDNPQNAVETASTLGAVGRTNSGSGSDNERREAAIRFVWSQGCFDVVAQVC